MVLHKEIGEDFVTYNDQVVMRVYKIRIITLSLSLSLCVCVCMRFFI